MKYLAMLLLLSGFTCSKNSGSRVLEVETPTQLEFRKTFSIEERVDFESCLNRSTLSWCYGLIVDRRRDAYKKCPSSNALGAAAAGAAAGYLLRGSK